MPLYEYYCIACGNTFEELSKWDGVCPVCPSCHSERTERAVSSPSPLKKGAFPFKPGPVHPMASRMAAGLSGCGNCHKNGD